MGPTEGSWAPTDIAWVPTRQWSAPNGKPVGRHGRFVGTHGGPVGAFEPRVSAHEGVVRRLSCAAERSGWTVVIFSCLVVNLCDPVMSGPLHCGEFA